MTSPNELAANRVLPTALALDTDGDFPLRVSPYKEQMVMPFSRLVAADEGSYFLALSPTPGTGVVGHAAPTTMDNTKPFIFLQNPDTAKYLELDYIKLVVTAAGTGGTLNYATGLLDSGAGYTSGGALVAATNPNSGRAALVPPIYAGAVVATASGAQRIVHHQRMRTVIPVVGDILLFDFRSESMPGSGMALESTTELERIIHCPPVIIAPGAWYKLVLWRASQSAAASYEFEVGAFLR